MTQTFASLGIPFPLFEAAVEEASEYEGVGECDLCRRSGHLFALDIGADVITRCLTCGETTAVDADDRETPCIACSQPVEIDGPADEVLRGCYGCLRAGAATFTKDTPWGMIRWEDAIKGRTHGVPGPPTTHASANARGIALNLDPAEPPESSWIQTALPRAVMFELLRTPDFESWQGGTWLFEEQQPMVYVGRWAQRQFNEHAPNGDGERLFREIVVDAPPGPWSRSIGESLDDNGIWVYVFRSPSGDRLAANWDIH